MNRIYLEQLILTGYRWILKDGEGFSGMAEIYKVRTIFAPWRGDGKGLLMVP